MSECYIEDAEGPCHCDNCDWTGDASELELIRDIEQRLTAGGVVPAGQCPREECGALAYLDAVPSWARQKVVVEVKGGMAEATTVPDGVDVEIIDHDVQDEERPILNSDGDVDVAATVGAQGKGGAT